VAHLEGRWRQGRSLKNRTRARVARARARARACEHDESAQEAAHPTAATRRRPPAVTEPRLLTSSDQRGRGGQMSNTVATPWRHRDRGPAKFRMAISGFGVYTN